MSGRYHNRPEMRLQIGSSLKFVASTCLLVLRVYYNVYVDAEMKVHVYSINVGTGWEGTLSLDHANIGSTPNYYASAFSERTHAPLNEFGQAPQVQVETVQYPSAQ